MAQRTIIVSTANSGGGEPLRDAFVKVNDNFTEVYAKLTALEDGNVVTDIKGNVFAEDSTLLVDGINGLLVGEVDTTYVTTENGIGFGQTGYTMAVDEGGVLYLTGTNGDDDIVIRTNSSGGGQYDWTFGKNGTTTFPNAIDMQTYSIGNVGTITATQFNGTNISIDNGFITNITGDLTGSVFADDSTMLVDGVAGKIVGEVDNNNVYTNFILPQDGNSQLQIGDGNLANGLTTLIVNQRVRIDAAVPTTSLGSTGDFVGSIAFDSTYMYYCTAGYDGVTNIWKRVAWSGDTW